MTSQRRGFSRERHNAMKAFVTAGSLVAFVGGWIGFSVSHGAAQATAVPTTQVSATPEATTARGPRGDVRPVQPTPTSRQALPATPRARTSRGS